MAVISFLPATPSLPPSSFTQPLLFSPSLSRTISMLDCQQVTNSPHAFLVLLRYKSTWGLLINLLSCCFLHHKHSFYWITCIELNWLNTVPIMFQWYRGFFSCSTLMHLTADAWRTDGRTFPPSDMPVPPWENQISPLFFLSLFFRSSLPPFYRA